MVFIFFNLFSDVAISLYYHLLQSGGFSALNSSAIDKYHGGKCSKLKCKFSLSYVLLKVVLVCEELAYR